MANFESFAVIPDAGFPQHKPIVVDLNLGSPTQSGKSFFTPKTFPCADWHRDDEERKAAELVTANEVLALTHDAWEEACKAKNLDEMLNVFSNTGEMFLGRSSLGTCQPPRAYFGRGRARLQSRTLNPPHADPEEGH